ncbi:MAG: molybdate ABC transporter substrate-binding protein [Aestuariibacter sp.]
MRGILSVLLICSSFCLSAETLRVAVAANFIEVVDALVVQFKQSHEADIQVIAGSSGKLYAQIRHGAPFGLFLSADQEKPHSLIKDKVADADSLVTYAQGRLVLLSSSPGLVVTGPEVLDSTGLQRLAIANPKLAPYGAAAVSFLTATDNLTSTRDKWVMGENISQTFQYVYTGNAQLGLVARSQVNSLKGKPDFSYWLVPAELHTPIKQDMVLLRSAQNNQQARAFWYFMQSDDAKGIITGFGYDVPNPTM